MLEEGQGEGGERKARLTTVDLCLRRGRGKGEGERLD